MATHPLLCAELLSECASIIVREASQLQRQGPLDKISKKKCWAAALDSVQGTDFASLVMDDGIVVLDSNFKPLPRSSHQKAGILEALAVVQKTDFALFNLLRTYVVGIVMVCRTSTKQPALDSSVDVVKATHGLWRSEKGHFVGSSTGHLGVVWIEADLMQSDLICGLVHEFAHFALNLIDMAAGVFTGEAYGGSLSALSPILKVPRPYALAMHALMVQSVLGDLGLRMSTDIPEPFDFEHAAASLDGSAHLGLTGNGMALFEAVRRHQQTECDRSALQWIRDDAAVQAYVARHTSPTLLFWGGGEHNVEELELCFELSDAGVLDFDGVEIIKFGKTGGYGDTKVYDRTPPFVGKLSIDEHFERRSLELTARYGERTNYSDTIFGLGTLTVEDPWTKKYADISMHLDCLNESWWDSDRTNFVSMVRLPCGQLHADLKANTNLTVAEACGLQPPKLITVLPEFRVDEISLVCLSALSGEHLANLTIHNAATTSFRDVRKDLADACGLHAAAARFVTADGVHLGVSAETVEALFCNQMQRLDNPQPPQPDAESVALSPAVAVTTRAPKKQHMKVAPKVYDYSNLEKGMRLQVESEGTWYAAEVVQVSTSKNRSKAPIKVSYKGYENYDEWVGGDRIRSKALKVEQPAHPETKAKSTFKLNYFPITDLGEPIRATLALAGIPFEDDWVPGDRWKDLKPTLPSGSQMPILHATQGENTEMMFQSRAILRYVGSIGSYKGVRLYPSAPKARYYCDEVIEMVDDFRPMMTSTFDMEDQAEKEAARKALVQPDGKMYSGMMKLNERLGKFPFAAGDKPSIADAYAVIVCFMFQQPTFLDGFPDDTLKDMPNITALKDKFFGLPPLKEHYKDAEGIRAPFKVA